VRLLLLPNLLPFAITIQSKRNIECPNVCWSSERKEEEGKELLTAELAAAADHRSRWQQQQIRSTRKKKAETNERADERVGVRLSSSLPSLLQRRPFDWWTSKSDMGRVEKRWRKFSRISSSCRSRWVRRTKERRRKENKTEDLHTSKQEPMRAEGGWPKPLWAWLKSKYMGWCFLALGGVRLSNIPRLPCTQMHVCGAGFPLHHHQPTIARFLFSFTSSSELNEWLIGGPRTFVHLFQTAAGLLLGQFDQESSTQGRIQYITCGAVTAAGGGWLLLLTLENEDGSGLDDDELVLRPRELGITLDGEGWRRGIRPPDTVTLEGGKVYEVTALDLTTKRDSSWDLLRFVGAGGRFTGTTEE
jgi:hypothetical protein